MIYKLFITLILGISSVNWVAGQTLEQYLKTAAENDPGLKAKYAAFEASMKKVAQVNQLPDPQLSLGVFILPVETRVGPQRAKIGLSQMFPWFGTLKTAGSVYQLKAEAKYQEFLQAKLKLFKQVKLAWYPLYEIEQKIRLQKENIAILETYKTLATRAFENGKSSMTDVIRVEVLIDDAKTNIALMETKRKPLKVRFNSLLNREEMEEIMIADTLTFPSLSESIRKDSLFVNDPQLTALDLNKESAQQQAELARKQGMPKIGVGVDYVFVGQREGVSIPDNGKDVLMPMVSVSIPIFRKKYRAAIEEANLKQESIEHQKEAYKNSVVSDYEMEQYKITEAQELNQLYEKQIQKMEQIENLLLKSYSNSGEDFEEILRIQQRILNYETAVVVAITNAYEAMAEIDYLTAKTE